ncbi:MAG TPA: hypothetical protein VGS08_00115 [Candidatus Saccharimonadales bacterium]|nr:hypothetical protein [Candidatus Saccharimonadales bacterium]
MDDQSSLVTPPDVGVTSNKIVLKSGVDPGIVARPSRYSIIWFSIVAAALLTLGIMLFYWHKTHTNTVVIDYVTIPTGVNERQNYPTDFAATAQGHYVYIDTSVPSANPYTVLGGKLLYDGRTIYSGTDLEIVSEVISPNGLHYAYMRYINGNTNIYVDNKLVKTLPYQGPNSATLYAVSDNGKEYAYEYPGSQGNTLFRNNVALYTTGNGIGSAIFSNDLAHYATIVQASPGASAGNIIKDGNNLGSGDAVYLSPNGLHDIITVGMGSGTNGIVKVDGATVGESATDLNSTVVSDTGSYAFTQYERYLITINGKNYRIPTAIPSDCKHSCVNLFAVNQNGSHYIVGDYRPTGGHGAVWDLDGKNVALNGDIMDVAFSNDILYVYRWSN